MHSSLLKFTLILNPAFLFRKLVGSEFPLGMSENFLCSMFVLTVKTVLLLDVLHLLMLFVGASMYLEPQLFVLIIFHNLYLLIITNITISITMHIFLSSGAWISQSV
jgi:hypothetical protein